MAKAIDEALVDIRDQLDDALEEIQWGSLADGIDMVAEAHADLDDRLEQHEIEDEETEDE